MESFICGSSDQGAIRFFHCLKKHIDLTFVDDLKKIKSQENTIYITGAALGDSLDKALIKKARKEKCKCISIIDHWSWYKKRFEYNNSLLLPDLILVNDEIALNDAIIDGLPSNKLMIGGNPVLEQLSKIEYSHDIDLVAIKNRLDLPDKRIIVFVSEELASEFNNSSDDLGYDEYKVLDQIIKLLKPTDHLVIKLHPSEKSDKYDYLECVKYTSIKNIDLYELDVIADIVVGMASMLLLELAMLRDDVISYRPNNNKKFIGKSLNATVDISTKRELKDMLIEPQKVPNNFRKRFNGSGNNISKIINEFAQ